ncbi:uncharacterized protein [Physcomitrium patens]|uniref:uncharacterized protein isoform X3 n=1 Tax=Physcomitrium patens TaxID=3218 RepID=UPI003CCC9F4B
MRSVQTSLYANGMATSRMTRMMGTSATNLRKNLTMGPMPNTAGKVKDAAMFSSHTQYEIPQGPIPIKCACLTYKVG